MEKGFRLLDVKNDRRGGRFCLLQGFAEAADLLGQPGKGGGGKGLGAVRQGGGGAVMDLHQQSVGPGGHGGQRQRLTIARALLKKPKVLILDDSTSAVDTATDAKIRRAFAQEIPDTTKFIIAQRVSSVQDADRILVMDEGCLLYTSPSPRDA